MKNLGILLLIAVLFSTSLRADETVVASSLSNVKNDEQIHMIALEGTPADFKQLLANRDNINSVFKCHTLLVTVIKSASHGQFAAEFPEYAIEKVKILIDAGVDVNENACPERMASPLSWAVTLPQRIYDAEEDANKAFDYKMNLKDEYCEIPGIVSKPCKDITPEEREKIRDVFHQSFNIVSKITAPYYIELVKLLVNNGAAINEKDFDGRAPIHRAALIPQGETLKILEYLIEKGVDINVRDSDGNTPLFVAFASGNKDVVDLLIKSGADTQLRNNAGLLYNQVAGHKVRVYSDEIKKQNRF